MMEPISVPRKRTEVLVNDFVRSVYNWMFIGLTLTGFMAYFVSTNEAILHLIYSNRLVFFGLIIAELALVFAIAGMVNRMSASTATALFVIYSVLNGVTLSFIFLAYARAQISEKTFGFLKFVVKRETAQIIGVHLFTKGASNMAGEASLIVSMKATLRDVAEAIHPHPTLTESFGFLSKNMLSEVENSSLA